MNSSLHLDYNMKISRKMCGPVICLAAAVISVCVVGPQSAFAAPTTAASRTPQEIVAEMMADQKTVNDLLGKQNAALKSDSDRAVVAPKLFPLVHRMSGDLNDLSIAVPQLNEQLAGSQMQLLALLSVLGEKSATAQIEAMLASTDPTQALAGRAHQMMARFYVTKNSAAAQGALADDLEKLDRADPDSVLLTQLTIEIGHEEGSPDLRDRVLKIVTDEMNNPLAASLKERLTAQKEAADQDALMANKPITLSGKLADGTAFSTDSLKGKVVLVDFWATWCGPCKAELPRVKKMYDDYHSKGLEIVGVSNDYDADALKSFVLNAQMPWPEFFDADAAAKNEFNSITKGQKIDGIPVMYLIDKKGVLRTVNARENMEELIPKLLAEAD